MKELQCNHCREWNEVCHDDGAGYSEDMTHEQFCDSCGELIYFSTCIIYHFETTNKDGIEIEID